MSWSGTVTCRTCWHEGHNSRTCPKITKRIEAAEKSGESDWYATHHKNLRSQGRQRQCSYCHQSGHNRRTCTKLKNNIATAIAAERTWRTAIVPAMDKIGLGVGALLSTKKTAWDDSAMYMVDEILWGEMNSRFATGQNAGYSLKVRNCATLQMAHIGFPDIPSDEPDSWLVVPRGGTPGSGRVSLVAPSPLPVSAPTSFVADGDLVARSWYRK
jgi:hypothetical protein